MNKFFEAYRTSVVPGILWVILGVSYLVDIPMVSDKFAIWEFLLGTSALMFGMYRIEKALRKEDKGDLSNE